MHKMQFQGPLSQGMSQGQMRINGGKGYRGWKINHGTSATQSIYFSLPLLSCPLRPNTTLKFRLVDPSQLSLTLLPFLFKPHAWATLFSQYKDLLPSQLVLILRFGALIGYEGLVATIISPNLRSVLLEPRIIQKKLEQDLAAGRVIPIAVTTSLISSPLGLAPKANGDLLSGLLAWLVGWGSATSSGASRHCHAVAMRLHHTDHTSG